MSQVTNRGEVVMDGRTLQINNFQTSDPEILGYFSGLEPDRMTEEVEIAIKLGVTALKTMVTTERVDYIEKSFSSMNTDIRTQLNQVFGEEGKVKTVIDRYFGDNGQVKRYLDSKLGEDGDIDRIVRQHFGPEGKVINEVFNPNRRDSPLWTLKQEMLESIEQIRKDLKIKEATDEIKEKTVLKGADFEAEVKSILERTGRPHGDVPEDVSRQPGLIKNSKKGDFVIDISGSERRIVVETKDSPYSLRKILNEMDEALENRGAHYGIFVEKYVEDLPESVGWFNEYNEKCLVVALSSKAEDDVYNNLAEIAYSWARIRTLTQEGGIKASIKTTDIREQLKKIEESISKFKTIRTYCTNASGAVEKIRQELKDIEVGVKNSLEDILEMIGE